MTRETGDSVELQRNIPAVRLRTDLIVKGFGRGNLPPCVGPEKDPGRPFHTLKNARKESLLTQVILLYHLRTGSVKKKLKIIFIFSSMWTRGNRDVKIKDKSATQKEKMQCA